MPRDKKIKEIFEIADDGMQGVMGYFFYVLANNKSSNPTILSDHLPQNKIQITHEWARNYDPQELISAMNSLFEPYHARICLISTISIFEGALKKFVSRLYYTKKINQTPQNNYKKKLEWAFGLALKSDYGSKKMVARIPDLCLNVDHARRLRNLWMHNNGIFDKEYENGIFVDGCPPIIDSSYKKSSKKKIPVILKPEGFHKMNLSHIELLHQINDVIQKNYFGQKRSYNYKTLKKGIKWHRALIGV